MRVWRSILLVVLVVGIACVAIGRGFAELPSGAVIIADLQCQGEVLVRRADGKTTLAAYVGLELKADDKLEATEKGEVTLFDEAAGTSTQDLLPGVPFVVGTTQVKSTGLVAGLKSSVADLFGRKDAGARRDQEVGAVQAETVIARLAVPSDVEQKKGKSELKEATDGGSARAKEIVSPEAVVAPAPAPRADVAPRTGPAPLAGVAPRTAKAPADVATQPAMAPVVTPGTGAPGARGDQVDLDMESQDHGPRGAPRVEPGVGTPAPDAQAQPGMPETNQLTLGQAADKFEESPAPAAPSGGGTGQLAVESEPRPGVGSIGSVSVDVRTKPKGLNSVAPAGGPSLDHAPGLVFPPPPPVAASVTPKLERRFAPEKRSFAAALEQLPQAFPLGRLRLVALHGNVPPISAAPTSGSSVWMSGGKVLKDPRAQLADGEAITVTVKPDGMAGWQLDLVVIPDKEWRALDAKASAIVRSRMPNANLIAANWWDTQGCPLIGYRQRLIGANELQRAKRSGAVVRGARSSIAQIALQFGNFERCQELLPLLK